MKQVCCEEDDLQHKLVDLEFSLVNRGYRAESVWREIGKFYWKVLLERSPKIQEDSFTLFST